MIKLVNMNYVEYDKEAAVGNFIDFLTSLRLVETSIGQLSSRVEDGPLDMYSIGYRIYSDITDNLMNPPATIYACNTDVSVKKKSMFISSYSGETLKSLLYWYGDINPSSKESVNKAISILDKLNRSELVAQPFDIGTKFKINYEFNGVKRKGINSDINCIEWKLNKETAEFECKIGFNICEQGTKRVIFLNASSFGKDFTFDDFGISGKYSKISVIKLNDMGLVKPFEINYSNKSVIIDGRYIYECKVGKDIVVGRFIGDGSIVELSDFWTSDNDNVKVADFIKSTSNLWRNFARVCIPCKMSETNSINYLDI